MINEIKKIIENYLNNAKLARIVVGTVQTVNPLSIKINDKLTVPEKLISGNLKYGFTQIEQIGTKLRLIRNEGGQEYYILEVIQDVT